MDAIHEVATSATPAQIAIAWALQRGTTVVVKGTSEAHLKDNLNAYHIKLKSSEVKKIDKLNRNYRFFRPEGKLGCFDKCVPVALLSTNQIVLMKTGGDLLAPSLNRQ